MAVVNKNGGLYTPFQFTTTRDFRDIRDKTGGDKITRTVAYDHGKEVGNPSSCSGNTI